MKRVLIIAMIAFCYMSTSLFAANGDFTVSGSVGIGTSTPAASAALDVNSSTKGFLPPRMTTAQRDAIQPAAVGLLIYNTTENAYNFFTVTATGTGWVTLGEPAGIIQAFVGDTPPAGWFECDGHAVSRTTFAKLFALIAETYGAGDGSTTFNLPNLRGEFIRGWDHGRGVNNGRILGTWESDELKSHSHNYKMGGAAYYSGTSDVVTRTDTFVTNQSTGATGGSETRPRNVALMYIIKY